MQHTFFTVDQSIRKPSAVGFTYDLGHATRSHAAQSLTETVYQDDHILASDAGYCTQPTDPGGPTPYPPRVQEAFAVDAIVNLDPSASAVGASWGSIQLANNDSKYDAIITGGWVADGHDTRVMYGQKTLEDFPGQFAGTRTGGTALDVNYTLGLTGPRVLRQDYGSSTVIDPTATNAIRNSVASGLVAGTFGSGGVMPSNWTANPGGVAIEISSYRTTLAGLGAATVVRVRFHGTPTAASGSLSFGTTGAIALAPNQSCTQSYWISRAGGAFTNVTQIAHYAVLYDATATAVGVAQPNFMPSITTTLTRVNRTFAAPATGNAPWATANPSIIFYWTQGAVIDFTIDFVAPQLEVGTAPTAFIPTSAGPVSRGDGAVNMIRTSDMTGAVVGTPGTLPNGWSVNLGGGISQQVVATGTDATTGYKTTDIRFFGTATSTLTNLLFCVGVDACQSQAWTVSVYASFIAGSQAGVSFKLGVQETDSVGAFLAFPAETAKPLNTNVIWRSRRIASIVTAQATTRSLSPSLWISYASGAAIDFTMRLMAPQCEGGALASTFIPTTSAPAYRAASYTVTGPPTLLNEPDGTNYVRSVQVPGAANTSIVTSTEVPPIYAAVPIWKHLRTVTGTDTNYGAINVTGLPATGGSICASIWIWLPSSLATKTAIAISLEGNTTGSLSFAADQTRPDQWQRITVTSTLNVGATSSNIVIRVTPQLAGDVIYTSAWQLEIGTTATSFIPPATTPALRDADQLYTARNILVDPPFASLIPAFIGVAGSLAIDDTKLTIPLRDASYWLERALLRSAYNGNGGYDGTSELAGTLKPLIIGGSKSGTTWYGPVHNITPVLVDPAALIYQVSDGAIGAISAMYEGGYAGGITFSADTTDLYTGSTPSGQYRTCLSRGCFQLGSTPTRAITCDVSGALLPGSADATPLVVAAFALKSICGVPDNLVGTSATLGRVGATAPITSGCAVFLAPSDSPSGVDLMTRILAPAGMKLVACKDGVLRAFVIAPLPGSPTIKAKLDSRNIVSITPIALPSAIDPPPYRVRVGYNDNYTVQDSDISPLATSARKQYLATTGSISQKNSPTLSNAIVRPNDPPIIRGSLVDHRTATAVAASTAAATQYVNLWGIRRRLYGIEVPFGLGITLEYGDVVSITTDVADFVGTTNAQIVGYSFRTEDASITLRVLV